MLTSTGVRDLLLVIGNHAVRALKAVEPVSLRRHALRNAAAAAALASARRQEFEDVDLWLAASRGSDAALAGLGQAGDRQPLRAHG